MPIGIINQLAYFKYVPAVVLLKINSHIGSPKATKNGSIINEQINVKLIAFAI